MGTTPYAFLRYCLALLGIRPRADKRGRIATVDTLVPLLFRLVERLHAAKFVVAITVKSDHGYRIPDSHEKSRGYGMDTSRIAEGETYV